MAEARNAEMTYSEVVKEVERLDQSSDQFPELNVAFLRNITIDPLVPYFKYFCYREGLRAAISMGSYDNILQEAMNPAGSLYTNAPDFIIVYLSLHQLSEKLTLQFPNMKQEEIESEKTRVLELIEKILSEIRAKTNSVILLHNFEVPVYPSFGILDCQAPGKQVNTIRQINRDLLGAIAKYENIYLVDLDLLQSTLGYSNYFDNRYWHMAKSPYTREASRLIANEYMKIIRAVKGKSKKCLVLDCDNTLWGGIVGEDSINNIKIGKTYPGSAYLEFQKIILNLYHRGVMLAICSKNNESDVFEVLEKHPDMVLRKQHFVSMKINWGDKAENLKEISRELSISLDSMVFVDDNEFEANLVQKMLPEVETILLPKDPSLFKDVLASCGFFDTLTFSEEDRSRTKMYRAETQRREAKNQFDPATLQDYYQYLEMEVSIKPADEFSIPRIAQLTQRTNQFNLTTKRYTEAEIKSFAESKKETVRYLSLKDRFGDSGIVGVAILKFQGRECLIDSFLLSCRIIGRGIEEVLLIDCLAMAENRNCEKIKGVYIPTAKNSQAQNFFKDHCFSLISEEKNSAGYELVLQKKVPLFPKHFKTISR